MSKKMLIDAGHSEETRVVVVDGTKVEDFDFEAAARRPIRGNIYLAKVTRVEPSLQAAFVEYGGNRHGFLAFNEIHPDYYQIPYEDRMALAAEEATAVHAEAEAEADSEPDAPAESDEPTAEGDENDEPAAENFGDDADDDEIDEEKAARRSRQLYRKYKIQEVVKRRQVLLVQVAKEERGNKGAALTTYLSLAGRYCVLMPNTPRGGGISRKIANVADRKRLKSVVSELQLPKGIGLIIRTAGASRTKIEIRRDADYLLRLWENIRDLTLKSVAPALIYEEGNLVKRAIRDLYDKDIDGVLVEGEAAYKEAKAFMRMLMPSHAKKVQHYNEVVPLFLQHQVEPQLEAIYSPIAPLKSGGYIVINPTEALVSIDVNSGRSTRERNIETTAVKTNIEAAHEAARQMRLRDLAGLIVIDFIDMDESKNVRAVEKVMKDALKRDRARLQMGRISQFGLMEISRQRRRTSLIEGSTEMCPHCKGSGHIRSVESSALVALRGLEKEGMKGRAKRVRISLPTSIAIYLLNEKRDHLLAIEARFQMSISVASDDSIMAPEHKIEVIDMRAPGEEFIIPRSVMTPDPEDSADELVMDDVDEEDEDEAEEAPEPKRRGNREPAADRAPAAEGTAEDGTRRRRRRRRRKGEGEDGQSAPAAGTDSDSEIEAGDSDAAEAQTGNAGDASRDAPAGEDGESPRRRRRRGRRGGRSRRRTEGQAEGSENANGEAAGSEDDAAAATAAPSDEAAPVEPVADAVAAEEKPKRQRAPRRRKTAETEAPASESPAEAAASTPAEPADAVAEEEAPKRRTRRPRKTAAEKAAETGETEAKAENPAAESAAEPAAKPKPRTRRKKAEPAAPAVEADSASETPAATEAPAPAPSKPEAAPAKEAETAVVADAKPEPAKPIKRGWWNKTGLFGK
tara:strand:+ start:18257 stop:20995 length:2739 start_codon:yes stop_codon:yes gene_type:complete